MKHAAFDRPFAETMPHLRTLRAFGATPLSLFCDRILEAGWLVAVVVTLLHFNSATSRLFEPDKIALLRSIATFMGAAWLLKAGAMWRAGKATRQAEAPAPAGQPHAAPVRTLAAHPLVLAVLLFLGSYALATGTSILPGISLWGYYGRLDGLYTAASYLVFFFSILALLRTPARQRRLLTTVLLVSLPAALYGVLQHFGLDPWPWDRPVAERVQGTLGNPTFLAATLSLIVPLTLYRLVEAGQARHMLRGAGYLLVLIVQLACILFTQSRGPLLGLILGLFFGGLIWLLMQHRRRAARGLLGLSLAVACILMLINLPNTPLGFVAEIPYLNRLTRIADAEGSSQGRVLIWEGAIDLLTANPARLAVGYGPETIRYAYYPYYAAELGRSHGWQAFPDRMHNETLDVLITTGLIGLVVYLFFFTALVYYGLRWTGCLSTPRQRNAFLALWTLGGLGTLLAFRLATATWAFSGVAVPFGCLGGLLLYLAWYAWAVPRQTHGAETRPSPHPLRLPLLVCLSCLLVHFVETNVGIAVSATRLLFWVYAALFIGLGVVGQPVPGTAAAHDTQPDAARDTSKKPEGPKAAKRKKPSGRKTPPPPSRPTWPSTTAATSLSVGVAFVTLTYSLIARSLPIDRTNLGILFIATWVGAGFFIVAGTGAASGRRGYLHRLGLYVALSLLPPAGFFMLQQGGVDATNNQLLLYYVAVLSLIVATAFAIRPEAPPSMQKNAMPDVVLALAGVAAALFFIGAANIRPVQANMVHRDARIAFQQQQYDAAMALYRRALALDPGQELYRLEFAQLLATKAVYRTETASERDALFREAESSLLRASAANPFEPYHQAALADVYRFWARSTAEASGRSERHAQAEAAFEEALRRSPENVLIWQNRAQTYEEAGEPSRALDAYRRVLTWDSTNTGLYLRAGKLYREAGAWQPATEMYEGARRFSTRPLPAVHRALVNLYQRLGHPEQAVQASLRLLELEPGTATDYETLVTLYQRLGQCRAALEHVRTARRRWPDHAGLQAQVEALARQCPEPSGS